MLRKILAVALLSVAPSAAFATSGTDLTRDPAGGTIRYPHTTSVMKTSNYRAETRAYALKRDPAGGTIADRPGIIAPQRK
jgi:hypothetical protein